MDERSTSGNALEKGEGLMRYRREESFRYKFTAPIYCYYWDEYERTKKDGAILDLSPNGLKLETSADLPITTSIDVTFGLNSTSLNVRGNIKWKKNYLKKYIIGLELQNDEELKRKIINELKQHVKKERQNSLTNNR